ncbi:MAG: hypothetical protein JXB47_12745 [Anaerolineae bacterium]|nr:hypothetical protein [Anaerolineae bacterium]
MLPSTLFAATVAEAARRSGAPPPTGQDPAGFAYRAFCRALVGKRADSLRRAVRAKPLVDFATFHASSMTPRARPIAGRAISPAINRLTG